MDDRDGRIGYWISGVAHGSLILWAILGGALFRPQPDHPVRTTQVSTVSGAEFEALAAAARGAGPVGQDATAVASLPDPVAPSEDGTARPVAAMPPQTGAAASLEQPDDAEATPELGDFTPAAPVDVATDLPMPTENQTASAEIFPDLPGQPAAPLAEAQPAQPTLPAPDAVAVPVAPRSALALDASPRPQDRPAGLVEAFNRRVAEAAQAEAAAQAQREAALAAAAAQEQAAAEARQQAAADAAAEAARQAAADAVAQQEAEAAQAERQAAAAAEEARRAAAAEEARDAAAEEARDAAAEAARQAAAEAAEAARQAEAAAAEEQRRAAAAAEEERQAVEAEREAEAERQAAAEAEAEAAEARRAAAAAAAEAERQAAAEAEAEEQRRAAAAEAERQAEADRRAAAEAEEERQAEAERQAAADAAAEADRRAAAEQAAREAADRQALEDALRDAQAGAGGQDTASTGDAFGGDTQMIEGGSGASAGLDPLAAALAGAMAGTGASPDPANDPAGPPADMMQLTPGPIDSISATPLEDVTSGLPMGEPLTFSEREGLRFAIQNCWNMGMLNVEAAQMTVSVGFSLSPAGVPDIDSLRIAGYRGGSEAAAQQAFEVARRAILMCGQAGFDLPASKYGRWRDVVVDFRPDGIEIPQ